MVESADRRSSLSQSPYLARLLYLLALVAETRVPLVVALTMVDLAASATESLTTDMKPDTLAAALEASLGVPVVPVDARNRAAGGLRDLARAVDEVAARPRAVTAIAAPASSCCSGTTALRDGPLRDGPLPDGPLPDNARLLANAEMLFTWVEHVVEQVTTCLALALDVALPATSDRPLHHHTLSDRVDTVLLNRWAGIPVFLAVVWLLFELTPKSRRRFRRSSAT